MPCRSAGLNWLSPEVTCGESGGLPPHTRRLEVLMPRVPRSPRAVAIAIAHPAPGLAPAWLAAAVTFAAAALALVLR